MRVLIADDSATSSLLLSRMLLALGYEVVTAANGKIAWELFQESPFEIIISDWIMPDMDGFELCRKIRSGKNMRYTYFILITALSVKDGYLEGMKAGADDFLPKPIDRDQLMTRLRVAERILKLQDQVKRLEGLLPTCSYCKQIEDEQGNWMQMELYISRRTDAEFSHGICPRCYELYITPELEKLKKQ